MAQAKPRLTAGRSSSPGPLPRRQILRTLPEQIAEDLGAQIASGAVNGAARLNEADIASSYGVSRAPVREAIRLLARRGLVDFKPRQGAFVVDFTLDKVIDLFNVTGVIIGLASRYAALLATAEGLERLGDVVDQVVGMAEEEDCDPAAFSSAGWRVVLLISRNCGSEAIAALIDQQFHETAWGTLWRRITPDFRNAARRREAAALINRRHEAILAHDGDTAEAISRELSDATRNQAVASLSLQRREQIDHRRLTV